VGVRKVIPPPLALATAYRRAMHQAAVQRAMNAALQALKYDDAIAVPAALEQQIRDTITGTALSWDEALWQFVNRQTEPVRRGVTMPQLRKPRDVETGEIVEDEAESEAEPKPSKHGPERKKISLRTAEERYKRLRLQNKKLAHEMQRMQGEWVPLEQIKRQVLACNALVKNALLAIPDRLATELSVMSDPRAIRQRLRTELVTVLNGLAYEQLQKAKEHAGEGRGV
jgi:hypothetical protein